MLDTKELRVRVTEEQYSFIKTRSQIKGFNTLSAFVRDRILKTNFQTKKKLIEIYDKLRRAI